MLKLCANDILQGLKQAITGVVTISASLAVLVLFFKPILGGTLLPTIPCSFFFLSIIIMATSLFNRNLRDEYRKAHKGYFIENTIHIKQYLSSGPQDFCHMIRLEGGL